MFDGGTLTSRSRVYSYDVITAPLTTIRYSLNYCTVVPNTVGLPRLANVNLSLTFELMTLKT